MALPNISFWPVNDIHLLRGQSIDLLRLLYVGEDPARVFRSAHHGVAYSFAPFFKKESGGATIHTGLNITVNTVTGTLTTQRAPPAVEKRNFLVKAIAQLAGEERITYVRVHIHQSIEDAWLTPNVLTVHEGIKGFKFSIRVLFDDHVMAEIGEVSDGSEMTNHGLYSISWSHPVHGLVDRDSGEIDPTVLNIKGLIADEITAHISDASVGITRQAKGKIFIDDQLSGNRADIVATLLASGNSPGFPRAHEIPNILFIPDGWATGDITFFDQAIDDYVADLMNGKITAPFNMLSGKAGIPGSINFWKAFISSRERGVTIRSEVDLFDEGASATVLDAYPLPDPEQPLKPDGTEETDTSHWNLESLIYHVGLPIMDDHLRNDQSILDEWKVSAFIPSSQFENPNATLSRLVNTWKSIDHRRIPEEQDTLLGLIVNDYTAAVRDSSFETIGFNGLKRLKREDLDRFLYNLKDDHGNSIGKYFVLGNKEFLAQKDFDHVVVVSNAPRCRENNFEGGLFISPLKWEGFYPMEPNSLTITQAHIKGAEQIRDFKLEKKAVLTHELGHSFGLEDEYGEPPPVYGFIGKFINDPLVAGFNYTRFTGPANELDWSGNVQALKDLLSPDPGHPHTSMLDANKLKWRYHRIEKCGVVTTDPTVNASQYTVTLLASQSMAFSSGESVLLRKRATYSYRVERPRTSARAGVTARDVLTIEPELIASPPATVTDKNEAQGTLMVEDAGHIAFTITLKERRDARLFRVHDAVVISRDFKDEPIYSIRRQPPPAAVSAISSDIITPLISSELVIVSIDNSLNQLVLETTDGNPLSADFLKLLAGEVMIVYKPMEAPASVATATYKYAEIISKKVLDYLVLQPNAFNALPDPANGNAITEIIDDSSEQSTSIPRDLVPFSFTQKKKIVGLYSGGHLYHGEIYHPTGKCFMRSEYHDERLDSFCCVCRYILVDMIDPSKHGLLNHSGFKFIYPV